MLLKSWLTDKVLSNETTKLFVILRRLIVYLVINQHRYEKMPDEFMM